MTGDVVTVGNFQRIDPDHAALRAAAAEGAALCTIVGIDGSFSRRCGAQIAVLPDGAVVGDLADTCLERELATAVVTTRAPVTKRYGQGSPIIDFRLPCGSGLDILIDPAPDRAAITAVVGDLNKRTPAALPLAHNPQLPIRHYMPSLRIVAYGEGAELAWLARLGEAAALDIEAVDKRHLSLGQAPDHARADRWTAVLLLFHDHEWELPLLTRALTSEAFYIGAQGGAKAREGRMDALRASGVGEHQLTRVTSPVGASAGSRTPHALALAALNDIVAHYEQMHPHG